MDKPPENDISWNSRETDFNKKVDANIPEKAKKGTKYAEDNTIGNIIYSGQKIMSMLSRIDPRTAISLLTAAMSLMKKGNSSGTKSAQVAQLFNIIGSIR